MRFTALLVAALAATVAARNCGFKMAPCSYGQECVPNDPKCTNVDRCPGTCQKPKPPPKPEDYQKCGGKVFPPPKDCPKGTTCKDDPRISGCGMACDRQGICIPDKAPRCRGIKGSRCPKGEKLECYDYPNDECDPKNGGRDCIGVCLKPLKK